MVLDCCKRDEIADNQTDGARMQGENEKGGFDWLMFKRLWKIIKILFPQLCSIPTTIFIALVTISFLQQFIAYHVGLISSRYYKVLGDRDFDGFIAVSISSTILVLLMALVLSTKNYVSCVLYISWRKLLCQFLHSLYFSGINYYNLNVLQSDIDNPDQRMTQDVDRLCRTLSDVTVTVIIAPFMIAYYSYLTYIGTGWLGPVVIYIFFIISTIINKLIMSPIVKHYMEQEKCEGNFRFKHMHIRTNAESIAFHVAGFLELLKTNFLLNALIDVQHTVFNRKFFLNLSQNSFDYAGSIISYLIIAIPIFDGTYDDLDGSDLSSVISRNSFVCMTLMYSLSRLIDLAGSVVALSGVTHRVYNLVERLQKYDKEWDDQTLQMSSSYTSITQSRNIANGINHHESRALLDSPSIEPTVMKSDETPVEIAYIIDRATVCAPNTDRILIKDLNLEITKGKNLLIMGPSSCGKSSLLRMLRGLWPTASGTVAHNLGSSPNTVVFLPQKALFTNGSLYEQIIYPLQFDPDVLPPKETRENISEDLRKVRMLDLIDRCGGLFNDPSWNWDDVLSPGEMQRLCFLRLFHHKPQYALLDEATSALSLDVEDILYKKCIELGITLVSVGHRNSIMKYHHHLLQIEGNGGWKQESISSKDQ